MGGQHQLFRGAVRVEVSPFPLRFITALIVLPLLTTSAEKLYLADEELCFRHSSRPCHPRRPLKLHGIHTV